LEDFAVSSRGLAEATRRYPGRSLEHSDEVREIAEADLEGDVSDGPGFVRKQAGGVAETGADKKLVRGHPEYAREEPKKVESGEARLAGHLLEVQWLVRMRTHPERRFDGATAIGRADLGRRRRAAGRDVDEPAGEEHSDLVERDVAPSLGGSLGQFAKDDQLGERRHRAASPDLASRIHRPYEFG
jgi:hypothetical protein